MIKVYFTASTSFDGKYRLNYEKILGYLKKTKVSITSGTQIVDQKQLDKDSRTTRKKIFEREIERIKQADCVIAEVTHPSHGVGAEIVYALNHNKPVLALLSLSAENKISPLIEGNPDEILFLERYSLEKLPFVLERFISYIASLKKRQGKLIVIEGSDGSGKTVQAKMLLDYLSKNNITHKYIDFPQYQSTFHGKTVARFLRGDFGDINQVSPYLASLAYAVDRASVKDEIEEFLNRGNIVVANRYVSSSMAHQSAKFIKNEDKSAFISWLYDLEYKVNRIPKENLVIYLQVPTEVSQKLILKRGKNKYLLGKEDIHEKNIKYLKKVEKTYLEISQKYKHWVKINCIENNKLMTPDKIHHKIVDILYKKSIIGPLKQDI